MVLLTQERLVSSLPQHDARVLCLDTLETASESGETLRPGAAAGNLAYVIFCHLLAPQDVRKASPLNIAAWWRSPNGRGRAFTADEFAGVMFSTYYPSALIFLCLNSSSRLVAEAK